MIRRAAGTGHPLVRVQPEREAPRERQLRPDGAPLERAHRPAPPRAAAHRLRPAGELLARTAARSSRRARTAPRTSGTSRPASASCSSSARPARSRTPRFSPERERDRDRFGRPARTDLQRASTAADRPAQRLGQRRHERRVRPERAHARHCFERRHGAAVGRAAAGKSHDDRQAQEPGSDVLARRQSRDGRRAGGAGSSRAPAAFSTRSR